MSLLSTPTLNLQYSACPSINPPAVTTRVGPLGHTIKYHQPTQENSSASSIPDTFTFMFSDELTNRLSVPPSQHSILPFSTVAQKTVPIFGHFVMFGLGVRQYSRQRYV